MKHIHIISLMILMLFINTCYAEEIDLGIKCTLEDILLVNNKIQVHKEQKQFLFMSERDKLKLLNSLSMDSTFEENTNIINRIYPALRLEFFYTFESKKHNKNRLTKVIKYKSPITGRTKFLGIRLRSSIGDIDNF